MQLSTQLKVVLKLGSVFCFVFCSLVLINELFILKAPYYIHFLCFIFQLALWWSVINYPIRLFGSVRKFESINKVNYA